MKKFDQELETLRESVVEMGSQALQMVNLVISVIQEGDTNAAKNIYAAEHRLDQMELAIDREAIRLLTVYSPVASDLRFILSVNRITGELERVGDQAVNMCEYLELLATKRDVSLMPVIKKMAQLVSEMMQDALQAFADKDTDKAVVVIRSDNRVDALNDQVLQEVLADSMSGGATGALSVILIARSLERIADQATNICEAVVYLTKGADIRHSEPTAIEE